MIDPADLRERISAYGILVGCDHCEHGYSHSDPVDTRYGPSYRGDTCEAGQIWNTLAEFCEALGLVDKTTMTKERQFGDEMMPPRTRMVTDWVAVE